ncbi:MAG: beta-propeller fold lactonase family protein, partial [Usitatibacter sp.]
MTQLRRIAASAALLAVATLAGAAPPAYVSNEGSGTISVVDTATDRVTATLKVGAKPRGIAVSRDGRRLYVSDQTGSALVVRDLERGADAATIPLGKSPEAIYLSPDERWIAAAVEENDLVVIVDLAA